VSSGQHEKLHTAVVECRRHAEILGEDLSEQGGKSYSVEDLKSMSRQHLRLLDQMAYRFGKLQTSLGERLLPLIFEMQEEPIPDAVPFAQKLQRLERLGAIPSAEQWRRLTRLIHHRAVARGRQVLWPGRFATERTAGVLAVR